MTDSNPIAQQAHGLVIAGSSPVPATKDEKDQMFRGAANDWFRVR
jgi:hypothetical protein